MDGNFQLKRRSRVTSSKEILGVPNSVARLWGTVQDVKKYTLPNNEYNKSDCLLEDLDSDFKAARNNNRKFGNRFDENGVFALCCGRHGIPITLFDIFGGESRKYALAAVENALKDTHNPEVKIGLMYDIICLSKKQIEETFPDISERAIYAVSVFHAFAHIMSCQMKYHPKYINGFGRTDGEGCERLWSYLNGFIPISRSMTKESTLKNICNLNKNVFLNNYNCTVKTMRLIFNAL
ncbi:unnamed protein product [Mucor hiemalis]